MTDKQAKTHVLYVISDLLQGRGGIQSMVLAIYQHIDRSRVQIDFVIHQDYAPSFVSFVKELGSKVYQAPQFKQAGPLAYIRWWRKFFKKHPEYKIVHGHMEAYMSLYLLLAKYYGRLTIGHGHALTPKRSFVARMINTVALFPLRWVADYHFACSVTAGEYLFGKQTVKKPSFHVIPNARDTKLFAYNPDTRQQMREKLGLTDCFVVGHIGRLMEVKNHSFLLKIFAEIYKKNTQARLLLVGDGPLKEQLLAQTKQLGVESAVIFADNVANPQDYYQAMDVFVFPSLYEGLGMALIEAQIGGLPCVFSDNLPVEVDLQAGLCYRVSLTEPPEKWADVILAQGGTERISRAKEAADKGFEIAVIAKQLEKFYLEKYQ